VTGAFTVTGPGRRTTPRIAAVNYYPLFMNSPPITAAAAGSGQREWPGWAARRLTAARSAAAAAGLRGRGRGRPAGAAGRRDTPRLRRPTSVSRWLGKVESVLANRRLVRVHPTTDSNTPGPRSARFAGGRGSAEAGNLFLRVRVCVGGVVN